MYRGFGVGSLAGSNLVSALRTKGVRRLLGLAIGAPALLGVLALGSAFPLKSLAEQSPSSVVRGQ